MRLRLGRAVLLAALAAVLFAPAARAEYIPVLRAGDPAPATVLIDQTGTPRRLSAIGAPAVVSFIYTRCPDARMCPLVTAKFARMQTLLRGTPVRLIEVTLDPAFDTPAVLATYGRAFGADPARWWLLSGPVRAVERIADRFGIATSRTQPGGLVHTEAVVLLDARGRIATIIDGNAWTPQEVVAEVRALADLSASPVQRIMLRAFGEMAALCGGGRAGLSTAGFALLFGTVLATFATIAALIVRQERRLRKGS